ncbi:hypothetical protein OQ483_14980 [Enterobacter bugandensis]|uniref:hypothetical protein n=1 Tax=Enterobacter TaxID=547 RepID=UPI0011DD46D7|nr:MULTISPECIES: hypothetical protein [Enterobacter]TXU08236.1 hypothetical protein D4N07_00330 [Enterobacter hormaechei]WMU71300.1 hypothetical protein OQ483_14980 [Enterobacter bugandensis]
MALHHLFTTPFDHHTDFTDLADSCERFCYALDTHAGRRCVDRIKKALHQGGQPRMEDMRVSV